MAKSESWYVRASQLGDLMKKGQKGEEFGKTAIAVIEDAVLLNKHGIKPEIDSKYLRKGIMNEPIAIEMFCKNKGIDLKLIQDNQKQRQFNDYVTGEPDIFIQEKSILADVKCSFNAKTFPFPHKHKGDLKSLNKNYWYQMQIYMWLFGMKKSYLAYCLTDHPQSMIDSIAQHRTYNEMLYPENVDKGWDNIETEVTNQVHSEVMFSKIPENKRIRIFEIDIDHDEIKKIIERIEAARCFYDELYEQL